MPRETLGSKIRRARTGVGLGLRELARRLKKTPSYLSDIENDRRIPSEEVLRAISRELPLEFEDLMALAGRFGQEAERYLQRSPAAAALFRRITASKLGDADLGELIQKAEKLGERKEKGR